MAEINKVLPPVNRSTIDDGMDKTVDVLFSPEPGTLTDINNATFQNPMTPSEMGDALFLGSGPHAKERATIKICDPYPSRPMMNTGTPEYFIDQTFRVYWDSTWLNATHVRIQADSASDLSTNTLIGLNANSNAGASWLGTRIDWTVTYEKTGTAWTGYYQKFNSYNTKYFNLNSVNGGDYVQSPTTAPFTTSGTGYYTVRIRVRAASPVTTCQLTTPLYLQGVSPQTAPWSGVPKVDSGGKISWDVTIKMPEVPGVEDWDVEMAEI